MYETNVLRSNELFYVISSLHVVPNKVNIYIYEKLDDKDHKWEFAIKLNRIKYQYQINPTHYIDPIHHHMFFANKYGLFVQEKNDKNLKHFASDGTLINTFEIPDDATVGISENGLMFIVSNQKLKARFSAFCLYFFFV